VFQFPDIVRVSRLSTEFREYRGTYGLARAPRLGDLGTVVEALAPG
jgi:hypothetical protein